MLLSSSPLLILRNHSGKHRSYLVCCNTDEDRLWSHRNFGFPSAIFSVFGADFVFASGTLFIARIVDPHEQSLAGGLFNTMLQVKNLSTLTLFAFLINQQLGTALGITVTTIIFNRVKRMQQDHKEGDLHAYQAAQWGAFAFGILGKFSLALALLMPNPLTR